MSIQEITGKAFEYACLNALFDELKEKTDVNIISDINFDNTINSFRMLSDKDKLDYTLAARKAVNIICPLEPNLQFPDVKETLYLSIQPDSKGVKGDVRDVICARNKKGWQIGFSCKHNHEAVKHPRLSRTIDFGKEWLNHPVSEQYISAISPVFDELSELKQKKKKWNEIENKEERFYKTVMNAFLVELTNLYNTFSCDVPENLLCYLLGHNDFYKIIAHTNDRTTEVKPFNLYGTLGISTKEKKVLSKIARLQLPTQILSMDYKKDSNNTVYIHLDNGWSLSLRIHSASEWVEPSLKFDVQLVGVPSNMGTRIEAW